MTGHASRAHAVLSASGAHRWMVCTPSAQAEVASGIPDKSSEFAEEGTFAHELSELHFSHQFQGLSDRAFNSKLKRMKANPYYSEELHEYVMEYVDYVTERVNGAKAKDPAAVLMFEERLDLSSVVPDSFGTGDVVLYYDKTLEVIDLKFGKGIEVSAVENPQLRLYGLGAYDLFSVVEDIEEVITTIVQPRLDNISTEAMLAKDLVKWGEEQVRPRAVMAHRGEGEFVPGEHCRFCKIKATCRARADEYLSTPNLTTTPHLLKPDEISDILFKADEIQKWAKDVQDYALQKAQDGVQFDGWKVVEGRSNRRYTDKQEVLNILRSHLEDEEKLQAVIKTEPVGIGDMEKKLGKETVTEVLGELIAKPPGRPTLVPESDRRPAMGAESDFDVIDDGS